MILCIGLDLISLAWSAMQSRAHLAAENLFLRKQLAMYVERSVKPRRADDATRIDLVGLSRFLEWRQLLTVVKPATLIRWHHHSLQRIGDQQAINNASVREDPEAQVPCGASSAVPGTRRTACGGASFRGKLNNCFTLGVIIIDIY
jgi:hypothetical protein